MISKKKTDRRPQRTKRQLSKALVELVQEKRFDEITVQNVIDRADVGRSTFYSHFRDKEDLLEKDWERFLTGFAQHIEWEKAGEASFVPVMHLFRHLQEAERFYNGLVRSRKTDWVFKAGVVYLSRNIEAALNDRLKIRGSSKSSSSVTVPVLANFLAVELFSLLKWWLDHKMPFTPERMDEMYHELVTPSVVKLLNSQ
jgi:AcrR family transcriptional regulator